MSVKRYAAAAAFLVAVPLSLMLFSDQENSASEQNLGGGTPANVPAQFLGDVMAAGSVCPDITASLIAAQIDAESGWNPTARSPVGASGIAQFMPATWQAWGRDGDGDGRTDVDNPADAILSQGHLMCANVESARALIDQGAAVGDVLDLALSGYNAGMGAVGRYRGIPPFAETQAYVRKIRTLQTTTYAAVGAGGATAPLAWAQEQIGKPYRGQGAGQCGSFGPDCYDCCGLVHQAFEHALGLRLPMSVPGNPWATAKCEYALYSQASAFGGTHVPATLESLQPGDLIFFQDRAVSPARDTITHVAIYAGGGQLIDAIPGQGVGMRPLTYYQSTTTMLPQAVRIGGTP